MKLDKYVIIKCEKKRVKFAHHIQRAQHMFPLVWRFRAVIIDQLLANDKELKQWEHQRLKAYN